MQMISKIMKKSISLLARSLVFVILAVVLIIPQGVGAQSGSSVAPVGGSAGGASGNTSSGGTGSSSSFCYNWTRNLRVGDVGPDVTALFDALSRENLTINIMATDSFNELLASAVVGFQEKYVSDILAPHGLTRGTGYVGPTTRAKLNALYGCNSSGTGVVGGVVSDVATNLSQNCYIFSTNLAVGSRGTEVTKLQNFLIRNGFDIPAITREGADKGYFGGGTQNALRQYQASKGINESQSFGGSYFGPLTRASVNAGCAYSPSLEVTYPKGGENMVSGDQMLIRWVPSNEVSLIEIVSTNRYYSFGIYGKKYGNLNTIKTGEFTYYVENGIIPGKYYVRVTDVNSVQSISKVFSINEINQPSNPPTTQPSITISNPTGGETYRYGSIVDVRWSSKNIASYAQLDLIKLQNVNTKAEYNLTKYVTNDGADKVSIPSTIPVGEYILVIKSYVKGYSEPVIAESRRFRIYAYEPDPSNTSIPSVVPIISDIKGVTTVPDTNFAGIWTLYLADTDSSSVTVSVNWGDGSVVEGKIVSLDGSGNGSIQFSHQYRNVGNYSPMFTVRDETNWSSTKTLNIQVGVNSTQSSPTLTVTTPNGGETVAWGERLYIKWNHSGFDAIFAPYVSVYLVPQDGRPEFNIAVNWPAKEGANGLSVQPREFSISDIKSNYLPGLYKVRVACQANNPEGYRNCSGLSNGTFRIIESRSNPSETSYPSGSSTSQAFDEDQLSSVIMSAIRDYFNNR